MFEAAQLVGGRFEMVLITMAGASVDVSTMHGNDAAALESDAKLRDFTVNALYYDPVQQVLIDPLGGAADLNDNLLRAIGDPVVSFAFDPLRALRGIRQAAQLRLAIDTITMDAMHGIGAALGRVAPIRLSRELRKIFKSGNTVDALKIMFVCRLLEHVLPGLQRDLLDSRMRDFIYPALALGDHDASQNAPGALGYFLAVFLWPEVAARQQNYLGSFEADLALQLAVADVIAAQTGQLRQLLAAQCEQLRIILTLQSHLERLDDTSHAMLAAHAGCAGAYRLLHARRLGGNQRTTL